LTALSAINCTRSTASRATGTSRLIAELDGIKEAERFKALLA
jgi:hypothetical protein